MDLPQYVTTIAADRQAIAADLPFGGRH